LDDAREAVTILAGVFRYLVRHGPRREKEIESQFDLNKLNDDLETLFAAQV